MAQHFLLTAEARSMSLREIFEMTDDAAFDVFRKSRWGNCDEGLFNQKYGLSHDTPGALGISGLQPKYRFQIHQ